MKRLYIAAAALFGSTALFAQTNTQKVAPVLTPTIGVEQPHTVNNLANGLRGETIPLDIHFEEDFSNGLDGMGTNGEWTTSGAQGDYWFLTYPRDSGIEGAYDPEVLNANYDNIPRYFGTQQTIQSVTAENGFMMIDADAFNSTETPETPGVTTDNTVEAVLTSPAFDLTGVSEAQITFSERVRLCCAQGGYVNVGFSVNNGANWTDFDVFTPYTDLNEAIPNIFASVDISTILADATDLTQCKIRFQFPAIADQSVYYWMIDDVKVNSIPENDLVVTETHVGEWGSLYEEWNTSEEFDTEMDQNYVKGFAYTDIPVWAAQPLFLSAEVSNSGTVEQTNVVLSVDIEGPGGIETLYSEPFPSILPGDTVIIPLEAGNPVGWGETPGDYTFTNYTVTQAEGDQRVEDNTSFDARGATLGGDVYANGDVLSSSYYTAYTSNSIWGNRMAFTQNDEGYKAITHIEFAIQGGGPPTPTFVGAPVFPNIRIGSVFSEEETTTVFDDNELEYSLTAADLSDATLNWISYELPYHVTIDMNQIYQAEVRTFVLSEQPVYMAFAGSQEPGAGTLSDLTADPVGWFTLGDIAPMIRFRTVELTSLPEVTSEKGVFLMQNSPNPFKDNTRIEFLLEKSDNVTFEMYDITGKKVLSENFGNLPAGVTEYQVERNGLSAGMYTYSIVTSEARVSRKLVIE